MATRNPTFTETLAASPVLSNTGGQFNVTFKSVPQWQSYATLYKQFCIRRLQVILVPRFSAADQNNSIGFSGAGGYTTSRFVYSVDTTPDQVSPATELAVLENNGAKIRTGSRMIKISCVPKPSTIIQANTGAVGLSQAAMRIRGPMWFNLPNNDDDVSTGENVLHGTIRYWCSQALASPASTDPQVIYDTYYKVTFSLRDPC